MEWGQGEALEGVLASADASARKGAAGMTAHQLARTANADIAAATLGALLFDSEDDVRKAAAEVAGALRGEALQPFDAVLKTLMRSPAFGDALSQLLITLEHAPDKVDELALLCCRRFVEALGVEAGDIRTGAAADARHVGQMIIRGLAQSRSADERAAFLDMLDQLFLISAYGIDELVNEAER
jgi:hypothetical protein